MNTLKTFLILLCIALGVSTNGQTLIRGRATGPDGFLPGAMITFHTLPDSGIVGKTVTDENGNFSANISTRPLLISVAAFGYQNTYKRIMKQDTGYCLITMPYGSSHLTLGTITVTATKPIIEQKADRVIFNVDGTVNAMGSDAYELLRRIPGVEVNNGSINIIGKGKVSIMVNDKLVQLSGQELEAMLRSMTSENIAKIEVITTPPAKYDAAGNSGLINIVTKKPETLGWNGNISSTYIQRVRAGGTLSGGIYYRSPKWYVYGTATARKNLFSMDMENTTYYTQQKQEQHLTQINDAGFNMMETGADYSISPSTTIGISTIYRTRSRDVSQNYFTDVSKISGSTKDSTLHTFAVEPFTGSNFTTNIDYDWKIDTGGRRLRLSINYFKDSCNTERTLSTDHTMPDGSLIGNETYNRSTEGQSLSIKAVMVDFDLPQKWADMSMGVKASFIASNTGHYANTPNANTFTYLENTQAVYLSGARVWGKWQAQLGVRTEYTQTTGISSGTTAAFKNVYVRIFPTGYLQYDVSKSLTVHINYSRRIERPDFELLNPFKDYSTDVSYFAGNPYLQPYKIDNLELGGMINNRYNIRIYSSYKKDFFTNISVADTTHNTNSISPVNTGDCWNYGILLSTTLQAGKNWQIMLQCNGYYSQIRADYYNENYGISLPSYNAEVNNIIALNKSRTLMAELGARYQSAQLKGVGFQYPYSTMWGGVKAIMFDERLMVAVNFNDPFKTDFVKVDNVYNHTYSNAYYDRRNFQISLSWKFGNKNLKKIDKEDKISNETNRAG